MKYLAAIFLLWCNVALAGTYTYTVYNNSSVTISNVAVRNGTTAYSTTTGAPVHSPASADILPGGSQIFTATVVDNFYLGRYFTARGFTNFSGTAISDNSELNNVGNGTWNVQFYFEPMPTNLTKCVTIINPVNGMVSAYWKKNGIDQFRTNLPPEGVHTYCFTYTISDTLSWGFDMGMQFQGYEENLPQFQAQNQNYSNNSTNSETNSVSRTQINVTNAAGGGFINFGGANELLTLQAGFNQIIENQQIDQQLQNQQNALLTNLNLTTSTNVSDSQTHTLLGIANNTLSNIHSSLNSTSTASISGYMTNSGQALGQASNSASGILDAIDTLTNNFGAGPTMGAGTEEGFQIDFYETTLDFDPDAIIPGVTVWLKGAITMLVLSFFAMSVGKLFMECAKTYAAAETGGVPNMAIPSGSNIQTLALYALFVAAFIGCWVFLFTQITSVVVNSFTGMGGTDLSTPSGAATGLLQRVFPIPLILSLLMTRITLQFTMTKLIIIAATASRWIPGK